jgi:hypothetical protein
MENIGGTTKELKNRLEPVNTLAPMEEYRLILARHWIANNVVFSYGHSIKAVRVYDLYQKYGKNSRYSEILKAVPLLFLMCSKDAAKTN